MNPSRPGKLARRAALASTLGSSLEWYDYFLYGSTAALVFRPLFFPDSDPVTGTLQTFGTYAVGFVARPLGGVIFGRLGDRIGRRDVLVYTLLLMSLATIGVAALPTAKEIGVTAPILLIVLRFMQGLALGGEWAGAVIFSIEHGKLDRRGLSGSWPQTGVPIGGLLTTGVLWVLHANMSEREFLSLGWRLPFLLSAVLVLIGLFVRIGVAESPLFTEVESAGAPTRRPLREVLLRHPGALAVTIACRLGPDVTYYTFSLFVITYVIGTLKLPSGDVLRAVVVGSIVQALLIPIAGALSDRIGRRPVFVFGAVAAAAWAFAFFRLLDTRSPVMMTLAVVVALACHAIMYGPQAALIAERFSTRLRYSGASLGYQVAGIAGGALAPLVALKLIEHTHSTTAISVYLVSALAVSAVAVVFSRESAWNDIRNVPGRTVWRGAAPIGAHNPIRHRRR